MNWLVSLVVLWLPITLPNSHSSFPSSFTELLSLTDANFGCWSFVEISLKLTSSLPHRSSVGRTDTDVFHVSSIYLDFGLLNRVPKYLPNFLWNILGLKLLVFWHEGAHDSYELLWDFLVFSRQNLVHHVLQQLSPCNFFPRGHDLQ